MKMAKFGCLESLAVTLYRRKFRKADKIGLSFGAKEKCRW